MRLRRLVVPASTLLIGTLVGGTLVALALRATSVDDVQISPLWLDCTDAEGEMTAVPYVLDVFADPEDRDDDLGPSGAGPGFIVEFAPRPQVEATRCQLELGVTNRGDHPFSFDHLDLGGSGPGGYAAWSVDPDDDQLSALETVGEDAHVLGEQVLEPDEQGSVLVTLHQNPRQCWAEGTAGANGSQDVVVSRWGVETRIPLPFTIAGRATQQVQGTSCTG